MKMAPQDKTARTTSMIPDVSFPQESEMVASWTQPAIWVQSTLFLQILFNFIQMLLVPGG